MHKTESGGSLSPRAQQGVRRCRSWRRQRYIVALVTALAIGFASPVVADDYHSEKAGHPLRIIAYVVHPVGVILDYLIMRPAHWLISQEPVQTLVGHED